MRFHKSTYRLCLIFILSFVYICETISAGLVSALLQRLQRQALDFYLDDWLVLINTVLSVQ